MEQEYKIKGIEKILEKISKEDLAKYYGVDTNADFESLITESFKKRGIPNNSEIGLYISLTEEDCRKRKEKGLPANPQDIASEFHEQDERKRAIYGINYDINNIYDFEDEKRPMYSIVNFLIDEPIKQSELSNPFMQLQYYIGGVIYNGLLMGKKYYEEHEEELEKYSPSKENIEAVNSYINNFMNEFENVEFRGGYGPKPKYEETDEIKQEKAKNEEIILKLTGKNSIEELSLRDFINLKRNLEKEERELQRAFEEKFAGRGEK